MRVSRALHSPFRIASSVIVVARKPGCASGAALPGRGVDPYPPKEPVPLKTPATAHSRNFEVLLVQRSSTAKFYKATYVFPGGVVDRKVDFDTRWLDVLAPQLGLSSSATPDELSAALHSLQSPPASRPPLFHDLLQSVPINKSLFMPSPVALKLTSLRELSDADLQNADDSTAYLDHFVGSSSFAPAVSALSEWSNWLTPAMFPAARRYDTLFHICALDSTSSDVSTVLPDNGEVVHAQWFDPADALQRHSEGTIALPPPQVYELSRLCRFVTVDALMDFAKRREQYGMQQFTPFLVRSSRDSLAYGLLPGDFAYPADPSIALQPSEQEVHVDRRVDERPSNAKLHRMCEMPRPGSIEMNIEPQCGHVAPVSAVSQNKGTRTAIPAGLIAFSLLFWAGFIGYQISDFDDAD